MNRAERRRRKKQGLDTKKESVYNLKRSDIQSMKNEATEDAVNYAMMLLLAIPIKVLYEEYGWGLRKRLPEFAEKMTDEYEKFAEGGVTLKEYADLVYVTTGIKFERSDEL